MKVIWLRKQYSIATNFTIEMVLIGINVIVPRLYMLHFVNFSCFVIFFNF